MMVIIASCQSSCRYLGLPLPAGQDERDSGAIRAPLSRLKVRPVIYPVAVIDKETQPCNGYYSVWHL